MKFYSSELSYNVNLEEVNYPGVGDKGGASGSSHLSTMAPQLTPPHDLTDSCLLQLGTRKPNSLRGRLLMSFLWEDRVGSSALSCGQLKLILF